MAIRVAPDVLLSPPLGTRFARILLVAFAVVHVVLAVPPGPNSVPATLTALVAMIGAAAIVVLPAGRRLGNGWTVLVVALVALGNGVVVPFLPGDGWPGYASWPIGAGTMIAIGLTLRARIGAAWISMGLLCGFCFLWSVLGDAGWLSGLGLIDRQIGVLLVGTLFAIGLRRAARTAEGFIAVERQQTLERHLAEAELQARREAADAVLEQASPTLKLIASGTPLDAAERAKVLALEGRLRDEIALGPILSESLDHALAAARERGVDVVVLTDSSIADLPTSMRLRAADWIAAQLERARGNDFVGRIVLRGRDVRVSATVDERIEDRILAEPED